MDLEQDEHDQALRLLDLAEREIESIKRAIGTGGDGGSKPLRPAPAASVAPPGTPPADVGEPSPAPAKVSLQRRLIALAEAPD